mgnify:CR=1 FL=1
MEKGQIVLVRFPFTDYSSSKLRPAVVISANNVRDVCVAFISSAVPTSIDDSDFILTSNHPDFHLTGLKVSSVLKMKKIATVDKDLIAGKIGKLSESLQAIIDNKLRIAFGL